MWFAMGFVTLAGITLALAYRRLHAGWNGTTGQAEGRDYQYRVLRSEKGKAHLYVGVNGPEGFDFLVRHERWYDRLAKAVGISVEPQTGNDEFDRALYLVSDDLRLQRPLANFGELRADIIDLTHPADCPGCVFNQLRCSEGRLWVRYVVGRDFPEEQVPKLANFIVPRLGRLVDTLSDSPWVRVSRWREPFVRRAAILLGLSTGLVINGGLQWLRILGSDAITVDDDELIVNAIAFTFVSMPLLLMTTLFLLGRTARAHLALFEMALVGTAGMLFTAAAAIRDLNMEFDGSPPVLFESAVVDKYEVKTEHSTTFRLVVNDWTGGEGTRDLDVRPPTYERFAIGDTVRLPQRTGYLGLRWLEGIRPEFDIKPPG